jgi:preprotein translocase subunit SecD
MLRYFLAVVVAAGIITGAVFLYKHRRQLFRPDFDRTGGTLLVFEVAGDPPEEGLDGLVEALRRRFDSTGGAGIVVRADGERRVEVGVPNGKQHDDQVDLVKQVAARPGVLRFRVAANRIDDEEACNACLAAGKGEKLDAPPRPPRNPTGGDEFALKLAGEPPHRYRWVRLSEGQAKEWRLDPTSLKRENPFDVPHIETSCRTGAAFSPHFLQQGGLVKARKLTAGGDPVFFLLVREPASGEEVPADALENVRTNHLRGRGRSTVLFRFSREGGERFYQMTSRNISPVDGSMLRHLAVILDGEVIAAPVVRGAMRREAQISGDFNMREAEEIASLLRGGPLPCRLEPKPVREATRGRR